MKLSPCHCSICNRMFEEFPDKDEIECPYCGSLYAHYADATCKGISFKEWKTNETTATIARSVPDATGNSETDDGYDPGDTELYVY